MKYSWVELEKSPKCKEKSAKCAKSKKSSAELMVVPRYHCAKSNDKNYKRKINRFFKSHTVLASPPELWKNSNSFINDYVHVYQYEGDKTYIYGASAREGDINADGEVDVLDSAEMARYLASWNKYDFSHLDLGAGDLDGDGKCVCGYKESTVQGGNGEIIQNRDGWTNPEERRKTMDPIIMIGIGIAIISVISLIASGYVKAPPDTAYIVSGLGRRRIFIGKAGWRCPFFERVDRLSLRVMQVDVKTSEAVPTNEFINVTVDGA